MIINEEREKLFDINVYFRIFILSLFVYYRYISYKVVLNVLDMYGWYLYLSSISCN